MAAEKAERELIRIKMLRYMSERIGQEMDAIITGVESFGMFCQGIAIPAEGMIHLSALGDDFYVFDQATRRLIGSRTKREYRLGDPLRVVVAAVDIDRRMLDLRPVVGTSNPPRRRSEGPSRPAGDEFRGRGNSRSFPEPGRGAGTGRTPKKGKASNGGNGKAKPKKGKKGRRK